MKEKNCILSPVTKKRLIIQGYGNYSDNELNDFKFGIRFAYALCTTLFFLGLVFHSIPVLMIASIIAFLGAFPPYHPFDYLYNYAVRYILHKPKIPPRTIQGRFACGIAAAWLTIIIYLFYNNYNNIAYAFGAVLFLIAILVSTTDICIPSMIYNAVFKRAPKRK